MICSRPYTVTATPPPPFDSCWEGADQVVWSTTENCIWHTLCTQVWSHPQVVGQHVVTVVIAWGKRPVPFRTRKLRPTAPMVLHPGGCGRVGHRRTLLQVASRPAPSRGGAWRPPPFNPPSHDVLLPILSVEETPGALDYVHGRNPKRSLDADAARNCI